MNNPKSLSTLNQENFSFFYAGHVYGGHDPESYWQIYDTDYPATSLLKNISLLKEFDFAVFGGDTIQKCLPETISDVEDMLLKRLEMPVFNSAGNHDLCLMEQYGFEDTTSFTLGSSLFLIVSSDANQLEEKYVSWLISKLDEALTANNIENVFVFTHRPILFSLVPELELARELTNVRIKTNQDSVESLRPTLDIYSKSEKNLYWFSGDAGIKYPIVTHLYSKNIRLFSSGLYDSSYDNVIDVQVTSNLGKSQVEINIISLDEHKYSSLDDYSHQWLTQFNQPLDNNIANRLKHLKSSLLTLETGFSLQALDTSVYDNYDILGYIDTATYDPKYETLMLRGWRPIETTKNSQLWFGYNSDLKLLLQKATTHERPDVAKIYGDEQLLSGFELTFAVVNPKGNIKDDNLCFFSRLDSDHVFLLPFNNKQLTFFCDSYPSNR